MTTQAHFDVCQFDKPSALADFSGLGRLVENGGIGEGFQIVTERRSEHDVPNWALTWSGLARVALCCGDVKVVAKKNGVEINHARRASVLYLYFRIGMSRAHIAEYLGVTASSIHDLIRNVRRRFGRSPAQTDYGETAQLRHAVKRFMQDREAPAGTQPARVSGVGTGLALPLESPQEIKLKRAERELEPEVWNEVRMKALAALGANLRARRRSQWKTSDTPHKFTLPMRANFGRKIHRAARVQLKAKVLRRLSDLNENIPRLPSRRCRHGIYGADTCAVCIALPDSVVWAGLQSS